MLVSYPIGLGVGTVLPLDKEGEEEGVSTCGENGKDESGKCRCSTEWESQEHHHLLGSPGIDEEVVPLKPVSKVLCQCPVFCEVVGTTVSRRKASVENRRLCCV